jgi:hypothetical protein
MSKQEYISTIDVMRSFQLHRGKTSKEADAEVARLLGKKAATWPETWKKMKRRGKAKNSGTKI